MCDTVLEQASAGPAGALANHGHAPYKRRRPQADEGLMKPIRRIARREPRARSRGVASYLKREVWRVNIKRIHRFWRQEGLKVPAKARNPENGTRRLRAKRINHVWSYDFGWDENKFLGSLQWRVDDTSRTCLTSTHESARAIKNAQKSSSGRPVSAIKFA
jgi:hypothetical protein